MNLVTELIDEKRAAHAGTTDAAAGVDASNVERLLDAWSGPAQRADQERDLAHHRASYAAQRARNDLEEAEDERRQHESREAPPSVSPMLIMLALVVLFVIEVIGATIMLEGIGIPLRHRLAAATAYAVGMVVVTRLTAWFVENRKPGPLGWLGAGGAIVLYSAVIVLGAAARFLVDGDELSVVELIVEGTVACVCVIGPAIAMHFASIYFLRARPAQKSRSAAAKRVAALARTLTSSHAMLERAQRAARDSDARRVRMKAAYLAAHRRELARLARMDELLSRNANDSTNERAKP
ncbi:MAG: hypothetical protein WCK01_00405 [Candidatus Uhrbacteria bacterium]